jgi:hypothetical protein
VKTCQCCFSAGVTAWFKTKALCFRSIRFEYAEDVEVYGVTGYRFELGKRLVDNGTMDGGNWCNCGGQCVPQGALNVSSCRHGAPAFVSYPHYLDADPYYARLVTGMNPDPGRHRFYLTLEPVSGSWGRGRNTSLERWTRGEMTTRVCAGSGGAASRNIL